jgi:tripartite-type tricarboxylate transporter receptor subunit TctC
MKIMNPRRLITTCFLLTGMLLIGLSWSVLHAADASYPAKSITLVNPMAPGGLTDVAARLLAEALEKQLKQPVVVVNKPGGAMTTGGYAVASAKPDGYTLGFFMNSAALPEVYTYFYSAPYSSSDLKPVCRTHFFNTAVTVKGDAPWNTMKDFVEYVRKNPGTKFGHNGKGGLQYVIMTTIAKAEKLQMVDVPYDGDGTSIPAIMGGHIPVALPAYALVKPLAEAKKLKVLAISSEKRVDFAPDVPALGELGYKIPSYASFFAVFAPKKTPDAIVKKVEELVHKITADKEFQAKNRGLDLSLSYQDSADFEKYLAQWKADMLSFFKEQGMAK